MRHQITTQKSEELGKWWQQRHHGVAGISFVGSHTARLVLSPCPYLLFESYSQVRSWGQTVLSEEKTTHQRYCDDQRHGAVKATNQQPFNSLKSSTTHQVISTGIRNRQPKLVEKQALCNALKIQMYPSDLRPGSDSLAQASK